MYIAIFRKGTTIPLKKNYPSIFLLFLLRSKMVNRGGGEVNQPPPPQVPLEASRRIADSNHIIKVMFQLWKDKEEVLRKNYLLQKSTNMYVTEDFSRKVRKHRYCYYRSINMKLCRFSPVSYI